MEVEKALKEALGEPFDRRKRQEIKNAQPIFELLQREAALTIDERLALWGALGSLLGPSYRNRALVAGTGLIKRVVPLLAGGVDSELAAHLLDVCRHVAEHTVSAKEASLLLSLLHTSNGLWCRHVVPFLSALREVVSTNHNSPNVYFDLPAKDSGIVVPALQQWPSQGYTFSMWVRFEPSSPQPGTKLSSVPTLYSFLTAQGHGHSAVVDCEGRVVVGAMAGKGRSQSETTTFTRQTLEPFKWSMVTVTHTRGHFMRRSEVSLYVDGSLVETRSLKYVSVSEAVINCRIGEGLEGHLGGVQMFSEALAPPSIMAMHVVGPNHVHEWSDMKAGDVPLGKSEWKLLFDGKLQNALVFSYNAKACEKGLCLDVSSKDNNSWFVHVPHATLLPASRPVVTHTFSERLRAIGGIQVLLPIFSQLDQPIAPPSNKPVSYSIEPTLNLKLFRLLSDLIGCSMHHQHQMALAGGFMVLGLLLEQVSPIHLTEAFLLQALSLGRQLLRQAKYAAKGAEDCQRLAGELYQHFIAKGALWIHTAPTTQTRLYSELAADMVPLPANQWPGLPRDVISVGRVVDILQDYYWLTPTQSSLGQETVTHPVTGEIIGRRPDSDDVMAVRAYLLLIIKHAVVTDTETPLGSEDMRCILLLLIGAGGHEGHSLDVLQLLLALARSSVPMTSLFAHFHALDGASALLYVMSRTQSEIVQIYCIKLIGCYLSWLSARQADHLAARVDVYHSIAMMLTLTQRTYVALMEVLTGQISTQVVEGRLDYSGSDGTVPEMVHVKVLETICLLLLKEDVAMNSPMESERSSFSANEMANLRDQARAHLTLGFVSDLLALVRGNKANARAVHGNDLLPDWLVGLLRSCLARCWAPGNKQNAQGKIKRLSRSFITSELSSAPPVGSVGCLPSAPIQGPFAWEGRGVGGDLWLHTVDQTCSLLVEMCVWAVRWERDGWQTWERILVALRAPPQPIRLPGYHIDLETASVDVATSLGLQIASKPSINSGSDIGEDVTLNTETANILSGNTNKDTPVEGKKREHKDWNEVWGERRSYVELIVLCGVLRACEVEVGAWKVEKGSGLAEQITSKTNTTFVTNLLLSLVNSALDILPLASSVQAGQSKERADAGQGDSALIKTSALETAMERVDSIEAGDLGDKGFECYLNGTQGRAEKGEALLAPPPEIAGSFFCGPVLRLAAVHRVLEIVDVFVFGSLLDLTPIEKLLGVPPGGFLRLILRLVGFTSSHNRDWGLGARSLQLPRLHVACWQATVSPDGVEGPAVREIVASARNEELATGSFLAGREVVTSRDRLRLRAILYRESDEHWANAHRLLLAILAHLTTLVVDGYRELLSHHSTAQAGGPRPSLAAAMKTAFGVALLLFRELTRDFQAFLAKTLVTNGKPTLAIAASTLADEGSYVSLVMFLSSSDWEEIMRVNGYPEWTALKEEASTVWKGFAERLFGNAQALTKTRKERVDTQVRLYMALAGTHQALDTNQNQRKATKTRRRHERALARRRWLAMDAARRLEEELLKSHAKGVQLHWKQDNYEDCKRRRLRLIRNAAGSTHPEATLSKEKDKHEPAEQESGSVQNGMECEEGASMSSTLLHESIRLARRKSTVPDSSSTDLDVYQISESTSSEPSEDKVPGTEEQQAFLLDELYDIEGYTHPVEPQEETQAQNRGEGSTLVAAAQFFGSSSKPWRVPCYLVTPGLTVSGHLLILRETFSFVVDEDVLQKGPEGDVGYRAYIDSLGGTWPFTSVVDVYPRRHMLRPTALELFLTNRTSLMFTFDDQASVAKVIRALPASWMGITKRGFLGLRPDIRTPPEMFAKSDVTRRWQMRELSNFEYLMRLNTLAGRTYNDLNQYPVFPWILSNYDSDTIDLRNPSHYRDLSKPVGALNETRLEQFVERYNTWDDPETPPFHYGSHYSTAGYVLYWLIRVEPYTTLFLNLQGGRFDHPTRMFSSIGRAWHNCLHSTTDVKELIPELFYLPDMLVNSNRYQFGCLEDGSVVDDVTLPPWAHGDPYRFVAIHRQALESDYVSAHLHRWIDLIFGCKQQGAEAVQWHNVFYHLTYEGSVDVSAITDPVVRLAVEQQIVSFGQTPSQLLKVPHPPRYGYAGAQTSTLATSVFTASTNEECRAAIGSSPVVWMGVCPQQGGAADTLTTISGSWCYAVHRVQTDLRPMGDMLAVEKTPHAGSSPLTSRSTPATGTPTITFTPDPMIRQADYGTTRRLSSLKDHSVALTTQLFGLSSNRAHYDKSTLAIIWCGGFWDNSVRSYALEVGGARLLQCLNGHCDVITGLALSEDSAVLVTASLDTTVMVWRVQGGGPNMESQPRAVISDHRAPVTCVAVCSDLDTVASGAGGRLLLHTLGGELVRAVSHPQWQLIGHVAVTCEHTLVVYYRDRGGALAVYTINGQQLASVTVGEQVHAMCLSKDGAFLATGGSNGCVVVRHVDTLSIMHVYEAHQPTIRCCVFSSDNHWILAGLSDGSVVIHMTAMAQWRGDLLSRLA